MDSTSHSLLDRVRDSTDRDSWNRFAEIYGPILQHWLRQYRLQPTDRDDLAQEVLTAVARDIARFEHNGRPGAFRRWLKLILIHRMRNFWRGANYAPVVGDLDLQEYLNQLEDPASELSAIWDREHDRMLLERLLAMIESRFTETTRRAFQRVVIAGENAADVANDLDMTVNAVLIGKSRILKELRREARGLLEYDD